MAIEAKIHEQLHRLHIASAVILLVLAVCAGLFMGHTSFPMVIGHVGKDDLASQSTTAFAPAVHHLMDFELRWGVVAILAIGAVLSLLLITKWHDAYHKALRTGTNALRWLIIAVTLGLMTEVAGILAGVQDVMFLKIMALLVVIMSGLSWLAEKQNLTLRRPVWSAYMLALIAGLLPWAVIITSLIGSGVYGAARQPWYVYSIYGIVLVGSVLLWTNLYYQLRRFKKWKRYEFVERNYAVINLVLMVAFGVVLIVGLKK